MKNTTLLIAILWAMIALAALPVWAGDLYVGAGASVATESFDGKPHGTDIDHTNGWDFLLGYRATEHFGIEGQFQPLQAFDVDGSVDGSVENWSGSLSAKVYPFEGGIQPFLSVGFGLIDLRSSQRLGQFAEDTKDWATAIGGGIDFALGDRLTLELAGRYWLPQDELRSFEYWVAGANLQWRF